jgi:hypothetical protein
MLAAACANDESANGDEQDASSTSTTSGQEDPSTSVAEPEHTSEVYADPANWLCRPDVQGDACDIDLDATLVEADGTRTVEPFEAQVDAPVDCFYLYPTISTDPGENSDLSAGDAEKNIAANQAARFAEVCNVYAPVYRQVPLGALFERIDNGELTTTTSAGDAPQPFEIAYADALDAFRHYMANYNEGRPFVLIGHSQGAGHLRSLVAEEIDDDEQMRRQMLSAMLIGTSVEVTGDDAFANIGACQDSTDTGCVVSYASFAAGEPPPSDSLFGRPRGGEGTSLCSNPAALDDDSAAPLDSHYLAGHVPDAPQVDTPWIHYRGLVTGRCATDGEFNWLEITNTSTEGDALPDDLEGRLTPAWGLHLMDVNLAIGNLVELVRTQSGQS